MVALAGARGNAVGCRATKGAEERRGFWCYFLAFDVMAGGFTLVPDQPFAQFEFLCVSLRLCGELYSERQRVPQGS